MTVYLFVAAKHLEVCAKIRATKDATGQAYLSDVGVHYYPRCRRLVWFDQNGPITKKEAVRRLTLMTKWPPR